ncbi:hypothetical protein BV25DRAFT_1839696 [Artomyces pyxidatus]|uniref:Uncharacterized protein n=1 Tax=Artomyces pyxidatus TaxID=48021 RepID=A0ACB8SV83_9AGAM|nr:hypothetical protein BV25DRAFT_1839696 [Artomyces pyxidatus]
MLKLASSRDPVSCGLREKSRGHIFTTAGSYIDKKSAFRHAGAACPRYCPSSTDTAGSFADCMRISNARHTGGKSKSVAASANLLSPIGATGAIKQYLPPRRRWLGVVTKKACGTTANLSESKYVFRKCVLCGRYMNNLRRRGWGTLGLWFHVQEADSELECGGEPLLKSCELINLEGDRAIVAPKARTLVGLHRRSVERGVDGGGGKELGAERIHLVGEGGWAVKSKKTSRLKLKLMKLSNIEQTALALAPQSTILTQRVQESVTPSRSMRSRMATRGQISSDYGVLEQRNAFRRS